MPQMMTRKEDNIKKHNKPQDIRCNCGRKVAEKEAEKVKIKCVKCNQIVEV
jgi:hypothetical protein